MYTRYNQLDFLIPTAEQNIISERVAIYTPFIACIETFCAQHNMLIGGKVGLNMLLDMPISRDSFMFEIYTTNAFQKSKELALALSNVQSELIPARTTKMATVLRHVEFEIHLNAILLCVIRTLPSVDYMRFSLRVGPFSSTKVFCIPEELQLISLYQTMYTPQLVDQWESAQSIEEQLFISVEKKLVTRFTSTRHGGVPDDDTRMRMREKLLQFVADEGHILVGILGIQLALGIQMTPGMIQYISSEPIQDITKKLEAVLFDNHAGKITINSHERVLVDDFLLTKYSLTANIDGHIVLCDVFNATTFELIPTWKSGSFIIGNPYVLLRFLLIDCWMLKLALIRRPKAEKIKYIITNHINHCRQLRKGIEKMPPEKLFQLDGYIGNALNKRVEKRKYIRAVGERFAPYYPATASRQA